MIGRFKPAQRFTPVRMSLAEYMAKKRAKADRHAQHKREIVALAKASGQKIVLLTIKKSTLKAQIDHFCSLTVRLRDRKVYAGYCLVCIVAKHLGLQDAPARPIQLAYHIMPRGDTAVRWDLRNMVGACAPCNKRELESRNTSAGRARVRRIHAALVGENILTELEALAQKTVKLSTADLIELRNTMKAQLEAGHV